MPDQLSWPDPDHTLRIIMCPLCQQSPWLVQDLTHAEPRRVRKHLTVLFNHLAFLLSFKPQKDRISQEVDDLQAHVHALVTDRQEAAAELAAIEERAAQGQGVRCCHTAMLPMFP